MNTTVKFRVFTNVCRWLYGTFNVCMALHCMQRRKLKANAHCVHKRRSKKRRTNRQKKPCSRISIVYPFICTTVTNYWLKFFGFFFFYSLSVSLLPCSFSFRVRENLHEPNKKKKKIQNSFTIGFEYTSPLKHFQNFGQKLNMIFKMRSQIKMAYIVCANEHSM